MIKNFSEPPPAATLSCESGAGRCGLSMGDGWMSAAENKKERVDMTRSFGGT